MDVIAAYESVGTYRGAAEICGTTHKTVRRIVEAHRAERAASCRAEGTGPQLRPRSPSWSRSGSTKTQGRISAKRLLPAARAAGYARVAAELPPAGRGGEAGVAAGSSPRPSAGGVGAG